MKEAPSEPEASKTAEAVRPSTSAIARENNAPRTQSLCDRVLKGAPDGPPLLPLVAEATDKSSNLKSERNEK